MTADNSEARGPAVRGFFDPATATWTYVVWGEGDNSCAVIDSVLDYDPAAGRTSTASADKVISFVESRGLRVEWVLETHIHADHLTAAQYIKKKTGGKTAISKHILDVLKTWEPIFHNAADAPPNPFPMNGSQFDHLFEDGEAFKIGALDARIIHTPGHTPADTSYIIGSSVFVGDSMFLPDVGAGRCDFPGGSAEDSYDSTRKLLALPDETRMYVGHDYPEGKNRRPQCMATVAEQKQANIRAGVNIQKSAFVAQRRDADRGKPVPELLLPSLQVNLRAGDVGNFIRIPVNRI
ncbi:MAG: MBL fold metallo-hydrolase [Alphaproteobacteria bacterium]|nr:MBL fold metallo-hydrolase [Alphaproteobacteria bacterium]MDE2336480.1 MBL fold metallo-hydrolase [Alphaproteobacteria bacterium]